ncbi:MAG: hypothetical protein R3Y16_00445 [Rikenellaceae bacterium]
MWWNKKKKGKMSDGYVSFNQEQIKDSVTNDQLNAEAYGWLDRAMFTSSNVKKKDKKGNTVDIDDIYPVTAEETEQMSQYLDKAEQAAGNSSDPTFGERLSELRSIVAWSSKRHWSFQWILIAGVVVTLWCISLMSSGQEDTIARIEKERAQIEAWVERDTTVVFADMPVRKPNSSQPRINSAITYKYDMLLSARYSYDSSVTREKEARFSADTAATDKRKKMYLESAEDYHESQAEKLEEYEKINNMKFKEISELALEKNKRYLKGANNGLRKLYKWYVFFMILIPLYLFAQRPYGYTITRLRLESKIVGGIQKVFMGLAGGLAFTALTMSFLPDTKVRWSDGSTTREENDMNKSIMVMKIMLGLLALAIFCGTSCLLMIYLTVQGLRRNYNWNNALAKSKDYTGKVVDQIEKVKAERAEAQAEESESETKEEE